MTNLLPFIIVGLATGSLYGLAAVGLVLTYRTSGVFNFAHGAVAASAAFLFYDLHDNHHVPWPIAAILTVAIFGPVAGFVMEVVVRRLVGAPQALTIIGTVGILLAVDGLLLIFSNSTTKIFPAFLPTSGVTISGVQVTYGEMISTAIAIAGALGLYTFLRVTRLGIAMRAVVDNPQVVMLNGDRPVRIRRSSWVIGCSFACLTGVLIAPTIGLDANLLTLLVIQTFGACAVGLFENLPLTFVGGVAVGLAQSILTKYAHGALKGLPASVPFLFLLVVLLAVPSRRFPKQLSLGRLAPYRESSRRNSYTTAGLVTAALIIVPLVVGPRLPLWTAALSMFILLGSLGLLLISAGQISLCHAAFLAVGATSFAHLEHAGMPWGFALIGAGLLTLPVGAIVAIPAIRLSGLYLALATFGFGVLMQYVVYPMKIMFGSALFVQAGRPRIGALNGNHDKTFYYVVLFVALLVAIALAALNRGRLGVLLRAMSESPRMLSTHGLSVNVTRLIVFCISAFIAGLAGALQVSQTSAAGSISFMPLTSLLFLVTLAICGAGVLRAPAIAALLMTVLPGYAPSFGSNQQLMTFGIAALVIANAYARRNDLQRWFASAAATASTKRPRSPVKARLEPGTRSAPTPEPA